MTWGVSSSVLDIAHNGIVAENGNRNLVTRFGRTRATRFSGSHNGARRTSVPELCTRYTDHSWSGGVVENGEHGMIGDIPGLFGVTLWFNLYNTK